MIAIDIDGVVANVFEDVEDRLVNSYALTELEIKNAKPFEEAWYWINHYSSKYDIMFTTNRDKVFTDLTWEWLREWDIPTDFVVFEENPIKFLSQVKPTIYIQDDSEYAIMSLEAGVNTVLVDRSYNQQYSLLDDIRVKSFWDIKCEF